LIVQVSRLRHRHKGLENTATPRAKHVELLRYSVSHKRYEGIGISKQDSSPAKGRGRICTSILRKGRDIPPRTVGRTDMPYDAPDRRPWLSRAPPSIADDTCRGLLAACSSRNRAPDIIAGARRKATNQHRGDNLYRKRH
jgi:hypothetical protein